MYRLILLLLLLLLLPCMVVSAPPTISHILEWDYGGSALVFLVDECAVHGKACAFVQAAIVDGQQRSIEIAGYDQNHTYCWQVRTDTGQTSNIVCTP